MRGFLCAYLFALITFSGFTQKQANTWYFGFNAGISFSSGGPVLLTDGAMRAPEGCATVSDENGDLLFYTNGNAVWNKNHEVMSNGDTIAGSASSSQSSIIVQKPGSKDRYYIFTTDGRENNFAGGLHYSEVNMALDNGLGGITSNKDVQLVAPVCEKLTATCHANGRDIWVVVRGWKNNTFYAYLITSSGVNETPISSNIGMTLKDDIMDPSSIANGVGGLKISPNGEYIGMVNYSVGTGLLCDFDNNTGMASNPTTLFLEGASYSLEFSPSSNFMYATFAQKQSAGGSSLVQFDLQANNIPASRVNIKTSGAMTTLQLGPDNKIYACVTILNRSLAVIHNPDAKGSACNFEEEVVSLGQKIHAMGLPNFNTSFCENEVITEEDTMEINGFYLPNAFSPNGDGLNDILLPLTEKHITALEFSVFDRWGELIHRTTNIAEGWDGKKNEKPAPVGVYTAKVLFTENNEKIDLTQSFYLIR